MKELPFKIGPLTQGLAVMILAFCLVLWWGRIGISFFDYSSFVDISYRLMHGQKMYVDIGGCPHAPLTYFLQALFFKIFGVKLFTCLIHAAFMNAIATGIIFFYFAKHLPPPWPLLLAILNAIYFYGITAWPWPERMGYLGLLIAFILWNSLAENRKNEKINLLIIGFLTAFPLWDKQNLALVATIVNFILCLTYAWHYRRWSSLLWFLLGYLLLVSSLFGFFWLNGWNESIFEYFMRTLGYQRFRYFTKLPGLLTLWVFLIPLCLILTGWETVLKARDDLGKWKIICVTFLFLLQFINAALSSTADFTDMVLIALIFGWIFSLDKEFQSLKSISELMVYKPLLCFAMVMFLSYGYFAGATPTAWKLPTATDRNTQFTPVPHPFFRGFVVQQPDAQEWEEAVNWLSSNVKKDEDIWVFPYGVLLYATLGKISTSPLVAWDMLNMSSPVNRERDVLKTLDWLQKERPEWVVLQSKNPYPGRKSHELHLLLQTVPEVAGHLRARYESIHQTQSFMFLRLKKDQGVSSL